MVAATLASLRQGGHFVEISKRGIWSTARIAQGGPVVPRRRRLPWVSNPRTQFLEKQLAQTCSL